jgi:hypothetical protein
MSEKCRVCGLNSLAAAFSATLLGRRVLYFECKTCSYVQTQAPTWLDEAYASAINICDTGIMLRNKLCEVKVLGTLLALGRLNGRVVDCAGGYGILTRLLRDQGIDAQWSDPYCDNLLAVGFEHDGEAADLVTAFEAFEHFVSPTEEIARLFEIAPSLLISTEIMPEPSPKPGEWWYYGLDHGQHVGFFRIKTLQFLADKFGKHLMTDGRSYHLFTDAPIAKLRWRASIRLVRHAPKLLTRRLSSKTWADFEKMRTVK